MIFEGYKAYDDDGAPFEVGILADTAGITIGGLLASGFSLFGVEDAPLGWRLV